MDNFRPLFRVRRSFALVAAQPVRLHATGGSSRANGQPPAAGSGVASEAERPAQV